MKIYTRTGDAGTTGLWGGQRVAKDSLRVEAYGTVDECNAAIGVARTTKLDPALDGLLAQIQNQLFIVGADLASPVATAIDRIGPFEIELLEAAIDRFEQELEPLRQFILPGGSSAAAFLHLARTICRRAERCVVSLDAADEVNPDVLIYLNRLSDFLFVVARIANVRAGMADTPWTSPRS